MRIGAVRGFPLKGSFTALPSADRTGVRRNIRGETHRPNVRHGNFDFTAWSPMPVGSNPAGASRWGVHELVGNGWEWTDTPFAPFPGFEPYMSGYPDYSEDFFDGKHFVLKGA